MLLAGVYDLRSDDDGLETLLLLGREVELGLEMLLGLVLLPDGLTPLLEGLLVFLSLVTIPADEGLLPVFATCNPPTPLGLGPLLGLY